METLLKTLRGVRERWLKKTAGLRGKLRRLSRKNEIISRAIAANKAFMLYDMLLMIDRGGLEALGVGDNSKNPLFHDAEKSHYFGRIMAAGKGAVMNGEIALRIDRRTSINTVLYPPFGDHLNTPKTLEEGRNLLAGM